MSTRHTVAALALPAFPLALLAGNLVTPTDSSDNTAQLVAAHEHGAAWALASGFELLAAALMPLGVLAVLVVVRRRGRGLATAAGVLGVLGTLGMAAISFRHMYVYGLADVDRASALHVLDRVDHVFGPLVLPLMLCGPLTYIALTGAAARARIASPWLVAGAVLFFVSDMLPIPGAEVVQMLAGLVTLGVLARAVLGRQVRGADVAPVSAAGEPVAPSRPAATRS